MREGRGKEIEEEKGSGGGGRESRQQSTRLKHLGEQRRREAHQAEGDVPDGGAGADSRQSRCCRARSAAWAAGWWTRAEEQPSRKQSSRFARRLLSSSPLARTHGKCLARSISCARSVFRQTRSRFPAPIAFRAGVRSISREAAVLLAPFRRDSLGVCGAVVGVRPTPIYAYTTPNSVRRTPYMLRSWRPRRPGPPPRLVA